MAAKIVNGRMTADASEPLALFIIGMRINRFFPVGRWLNVVRAMQRMLAELKASPDSGLLHAEGALSGLRTLFFVQYWRSFDALESYARDPDLSHWPAWREFNRVIGNDGSVGIFHETYVLSAGARESVYVNMPPFGLAAVFGPIAATGSRNEARQRLKL